MASQQQVKEYLAYWLQLGKRLVIQNGQYPTGSIPVLHGDRFSPEFEQYWSQVMAVAGQDCYLEGTTVTLQQLLSPAWDIDACARCEVPVGKPIIMNGDLAPCPCADLPHWPNAEIPTPHLPIDSQKHFDQLRERLRFDQDDVSSTLSQPS